MHELVRCWPRFGYRRIHKLLGNEGFKVNRKRVWRLWKRESFKVPRRTVQRRRLVRSENGNVRRRAQSIDNVWCWDFVHDRYKLGRPQKSLIPQDEFTRKRLALEVKSSIKAKDVIDVLAEVMLVRGVPRQIRSDNGPEFIAEAIRKYLERAALRHCTSSQELPGRTASRRASPGD